MRAMVNHFCHHDIQNVRVDSTTRPYSIQCDVCEDAIAQGLAEMVDAVLTKTKYAVEVANEKIANLEKQVIELKRSG